MRVFTSGLILSLGLIAVSSAGATELYFVDQYELKRVTVPALPGDFNEWVPISAEDAVTIGVHGIDTTTEHLHDLTYHPGTGLFYTWMPHGAVFDPDLGLTVSDYTIFSIDPVTGAGSLVGTHTTPGYMRGLAYADDIGELVMSSAGEAEVFGGPPPPFNVLNTISAVDGSFTQYATVPAPAGSPDPLDINALAYDSTLNRFYHFDNDTFIGTNVLYYDDAVQGEVLVYSNGGVAIEDLAYDEEEDRLFSLDNGIVTEYVDLDLDGFLDQVVTLGDISGLLGDVVGISILHNSPTLEGDLDGDGFVGITDLNIVLGNWNQSVPPGDPLADPSGDGFVGIEDLNTVLGNWNAGTPPPAEALASVPEPGALGVLVVGLAVVMSRVRGAQF